METARLLRSEIAASGGTTMPAELTKGTFWGNCELLVPIGRGGMATVWVARRHGATPDADRLVAVKAMRAELAEEHEFREMFRDEVNLIRRVNHQNVVDVYDVGEYEGVPYMVMEWVEGESLHAIIAEAGKRRAIPAEMAVRMIADAAAGLHAAHELRDDEGKLRGVVHRDISPQNILIGTDGRVKLVDFGVAKALGRVTETTRAGQLKGKFAYMAPEQALGRALDRRADVFALGIVLYELTTNRRLFRGQSDLETLQLVLHGEIPHPTKNDSRYPPALEAIVLRALERDVNQRFQSAVEFERELRACLKAERIVVARSGIAGLLKRVMSTRIDQRRKVIRAALKSLDSQAVEPATLISSEPAFTPTGTGTGTGTDAGRVSITHAGTTATETGTSSPGPSPSGGVTNGEALAIPRGRATRWSSWLSEAERRAGGRVPLLAFGVGALGVLFGVTVAIVAATSGEPRGISGAKSVPLKSSASAVNSAPSSSGATPTDVAPSAVSEPVKVPEKSPPSGNLTIEDLDAAE